MSPEPLPDRYRCAYCRQGYVVPELARLCCPTGDAVIEEPATCPVVLAGEPCTSGQRIVKRLCLYHYKQVAAGRKVTRWEPRRARGSSSVRDDQGRKQCARCSEWRDPERFTPRKKAPDGLQSWCSTCAADYMSVNRWGITRAEVEALVDEQGGCAICGRTDPGGSDYRSGWHVDHDHACCPGGTSCGRCMRSILCSRCNKVLGAVNDDQSVLRAAADYLSDCERRHEALTEENK